MFLPKALPRKKKVQSPARVPKKAHAMTWSSSMYCNFEKIPPRSTVVSPSRNVPITIAIYPYRAIYSSISGSSLPFFIYLHEEYANLVEKVCGNSEKSHVIDVRCGCNY